MENWSIVAGSSEEQSPYLAPELIRPHLHGEVYGHPNFKEGERIMTAPITICEGLVAETPNTLYYLGLISYDFAKWCEKQGIILDPENPIKIS